MSEADDLAQATLLRVWLFWEQSEDGYFSRDKSTEWYPFVRRIARNAWRDSVRSDQRRRRREVRSLDGLLESPTPRSHCNRPRLTESTTPAAEDAVVIREAIRTEHNKFSGFRYNLIEGWLFEGKSGSHIAATSEISTATVYRRIAEVREEMAQALRDV